MLRVRFLLLCFISVLALGSAAQSELPAIFQPAPRPLPSRVQYNSGITLNVYFASLTQGGSGLIGLKGAGISGAQFRFRGVEGPFFSLGADAWHALIAVDMDAPPRSYELTVVVQKGGNTVSFSQDLLVESAGYILQEFDLPADRAYLADAAVETAELDTLAALTAEASAEPLWDGSGFELPLDSPLTSPFGSFRVLNGARATRHTGWDQVAPVGTPIRALAAGRVVFADRLEIRGNYALIDHGLGFYSGYAHFSELHVTAGQQVAAGQVIGSSGNTGRSSGPHLHWELMAGGRWIDGAAFLNLWLPAGSSSAPER